MARASVVIVLLVFSFALLATPMASQAQTTSAELLQLGDGARLAGNLDGAIGFYQDLLKQAPDAKVAVKAQMGIGWCYLGNKDFAAAEVAFRRLVAAYLNEHAVRAEALMRLFYLDLRKGDAAQAKAELASVLADSGPVGEIASEAYLRLGALALRDKDKQSALQYAVRSTVAAPGSPRAQAAREQLATFAALEDQEAAYKQLLEDAQMGAAAGVALGDLYRQQRKRPELLTEAIAAYEKVLAEHPEDEASCAGAQLRLGYAYGSESKRDYTRAIAELQKVLDRYPNQKRACDAARLEKGYMLHKADRAGEAVTALEEALGADPAEKEVVLKAHFWLGQAWRALGKHERALADYREALNPYVGSVFEVLNMTSRVEIAKALKAQGNETDAVAELRGIAEEDNPHWAAVAKHILEDWTVQRSLDTANNGG